ncbi:autotransporter-associated beta strand repeat-containing protein [Rariglobus hedericola]|uniref:PEP-CTERM sorting domain-containing protein n=1 Tax=Rariglobus hedericola TaxID=2597822 RepID=A0A556QRR7_9BACT|nr:autotransporter-associated beta strand repeat-containing protein [Rariglobus hedericola]TSJ79334.1 PEP-CTERM sorting domain-containing protein [Rariglobus hedericola]
MKTSLHPLSLVLLSAITALSAHAANLAWSPSGTFGGTVSAPTGSGGAGTWDTTSAFWSNSSGVVAWNNANGDTAIFGGTAATVTLGSDITVNDITITPASYVIARDTGNAFSLNVTGTITNANAATITAKLSGSSGLTKSGIGTLGLFGTVANTYTGNTVINAGTLQPRANGALPTGTTVIIGTGTNVATLDVRVSQTIAGLTTGGTGAATVTNNQTNGTTTLTVSSTSTDSTFSGVIKDGDATKFIALTKSGSSTFTLTGANTYSGATTVNAGTLATGSTGTFGGGNVSVAAGAALTFGNNASIGDLKALTFASTSSIALNFTGAETVGSVFNSVTATFLADGTYDATGLNNFFGVSAFSGTGSLTVSAIPEPATVAMLAGLAGLGLAATRRRRHA